MKFLDQKILNSIKNVIGDVSSEKVIGLHEPYFRDTKALDYVKDCIDTTWVSSNGEWVTKFENQLCQFTGAKYAIAVSNCTVALRLALYLVGVKPDDEVIIPPISFVATANAVRHIGAFPHFVDIERNSLGICPIALRKHLENIAVKKSGLIFNKITGRKIAAILPVHIFGMPADVISIKEIADEWCLPIIEDAAEALGSKWITFHENIHCGLIGKIGCLSFNGNKIITTGGGGALITNNEDLAARARHLSNTAKVNHKWDFFHDAVGWNDRMPNINAALGFAQLEIIKNRLTQKCNLYNLYQEEFKNYDDIELLKSPENTISNNWLISIRLLHKDPKECEKILERTLINAHSQGLLLRPLWKRLNSLPMYKNSPSNSLQVAKNEEKRIINLPSSPQLIIK